MHHEITKRFPTVSARDLGRIAGAEMLEVWPKGRRIIHVEGPKRFSAEDVAAAFSSLLGLDVQAVALPRAQWMSTLHASGIEQNTARCLVEFFDTCNSGIIDIHRDGKIRLGRTELASALEHVFACSLLESNAVMGEKSKLIPAAHAERARIKDER